MLLEHFVPNDLLNLISSFTIYAKHLGENLMTNQNVTDYMYVKKYQIGNILNK